MKKKKRSKFEQKISNGRKINTKCSYSRQAAYRQLAHPVSKELLSQAQGLLEQAKAVG